MNPYNSKAIKNIALLGNDGSGKTTLTESLLYHAGALSRRGRITAKNTVSDYLPVEQEYGYSVYATAFHVEWKGKKLNLIDCPGGDEFVGAALTALSVTDTALLLVNAATGHEVGTQNHFRLTTKLRKPVIFLLNQLDHPDCDYDAVVAELQDIYGSKALPVQYPLSTGEGFHSLIDVILMKQLTWPPEGGEPTLSDIPESEQARAQSLHRALVEAAAENDEALMEQFFATEQLSEDQMREGIRKGMATRSLFPIFCVCASRDMGVGRLMEFLGNVVPFVDEMPPTHNTRGMAVAPLEDGPTSLHFFKTCVEPHIGEVQYFKVMSGIVHEGDELHNTDRGSKERLNQLFVCSGAQRERVSQLSAGDIGCTVKLKDVRTGNTLNARDCDHRFNFIKYPLPKFTRAIRATNEADSEKLIAALYRLSQQDPTWVVEQSKELRQTLVGAQGEFHLRTLKWQLENIDKIAVEFQAMRIPYRETLTRSARATHRHKKQSGGAGQFAEVQLVVEPYYEGMPDPTSFHIDGQDIKLSIRSREEVQLEWGGRLVFLNSVVGGAIDTRFMPAILKGLMARMEQGPLTGSYARDVRVTVIDGKMHAVDSNELSFMLAARKAFSEAFRKAAPKLLEPIYDVEVFTPSDRMGDVMSDLQNRRGLIVGISSEHGYEKIQAKVPLKELSSFQPQLSGLTGGRASFTQQFASYELVPSDVQERLVAELSVAEED